MVQHLLCVISKMLEDEKKRTVRESHNSGKSQGQSVVELIYIGQLEGDK